MTTGAFVKIQQSLADRKVALVAVSKTKSPEEIMTVYNQGQRIFGENRVQELQHKHPLLPADVEWHMIGHLQTNKVKHIAPFVTMIHSVDSIKLLNRIEHDAANNDRVIDVLLQFKIALEPSKFGLDPDDLSEISMALTEPRKHVRIRGVMGMASFISDEAQIRNEFRRLKGVFDTLHAKHLTETHFDTISMGMSGDYEIAMDEGSTMVRIGSLIFGARV